MIMMKKTIKMMMLWVACLGLMVVTTACDSDDDPQSDLKNNIVNAGWMNTEYAVTVDGKTYTTTLYGDVTKDGEAFTLNAVMYFYDDDSMKIYVLMEDNKWDLMYTGTYEIDNDGKVLTLNYNEIDYVPVFNVVSYTSTTLVLQSSIDEELHSATFTRLDKDLNIRE